MRKNVLFFFMFLLFVVVCFGTGGGVRVKTNINRDWKYFQGDLNDFPEGVAYDDTKWEQVGLPHSFSIPYEFRSYEGGKSVIRATADGLEESVFVVTTKGLPRYREGVTPVAGERKYKISVRCVNQSRRIFLQLVQPKHRE